MQENYTRNLPRFIIDLLTHELIQGLNADIASLHLATWNSFNLRTSECNLQAETEFLLYEMTLFSQPQERLTKGSTVFQRCTILYFNMWKKMPIRSKRWFLLQILLLAQHVSGTIMPIIRSSRVLYRRLLPVVFGALVFKLSVWCGAEGYVSGLRAAAFLIHMLNPGSNKRIVFSDGWKFA